MSETKERPWADVNRAWLDGKDIQFLREDADDWFDWTHTFCPSFGGSNTKWRIKPIVKPDVSYIGETRIEITMYMSAGNSYTHHHKGKAEVIMGGNGKLKTIKAIQEK